MLARKPFEAPRRYPQVEYRQPKQLIPALQRAVKIMNHAEVRTVEALLVRVTGDFVAGMVLHRLLAWFPFSKRTDGMIWKSDRDWESELGLSYRQMARAREVLAGLVCATVKRAHGSPTYHYSLDIDALLRKIAGVYDCTLLFAKVLIFEKRELPCSRNRNMEVHESATSMFTKPQKPEQTILQTEKQEEPQTEVRSLSFPRVVSFVEADTPELWTLVLNQLEQQLNPELWVHVRGASAELRGDELVLRGQHPQWLLRVKRNIAKLAAGLSGRKITITVKGMQDD